ncbi:cellulose synthase like [Rhynchospora pubera]|uniref:glucomannan 4-beta-mannosyltransferase n=1 Tax=Rhynchospora pubera TaxID=906938 RepID=A0AAV8D450_9POAL|nr:cellulose synthase like [Rhynchospora pubera]
MQGIIVAYRLVVELFGSAKLFLARVNELAFTPGVAEILEQILVLWRITRQKVLVPTFQVIVIVCMAMSVIVLIEKALLGVVSWCARVSHRRPEKIYKCDPIAEDKELGSLAYPMVLVQIPMYNEMEVYQLSIGAACRLTWPVDRLIVQVLDDSTDPLIKALVEKECQKWRKQGRNVRYETREDRGGYKAGNLREGMKHDDYVQDCEYVAIFDADFQPESDFLVTTVPFLVHNPRLALVQARWTFVNSNDCLLTRMQEISMDYHFKVEQEAGSSICGFFGYNGTAGVWRVQVLNEAGGWNDRTTAEDMDLAVRAALLGWDFLYVGAIKVKSELPSTLKAYRSQQHRWSCGPALLFKKMLLEILMAKKLSIGKKFYIVYNFFIARRFISAFFTFFFFSLLLPMKIFFPEITIPGWESVLIPTTITLLHAVGTPRSFYLLVLWVLFENVMALHRCKAILIGLVEAGRVNEWIVTEKLGNRLKMKHIVNVTRRFLLRERFHLLELMLGTFLLLCACFDFGYRENYFYVFIIPQSIAYFVVGFGYVGVVVPNLDT